MKGGLKIKKMKFNFRKISAVVASGLMTVSAVGFAAAANFPAPFVVGGSADGAVVYGTGAGALDQTPANSIGNYLASKVTVGSGAPTGESVLLAKSSDNINVGDTWGVFTGTIDDTDLPTLLADGIYTADDNDDFDYEQSIKVGSPILSHFRDSDYESEVGLSERTPTLGFKLSSSTFVMNYTLDFIDDAESDIVSGDMDDFEGSDLVLFGKTYYISDFKNGTATANFGKLTLLDSASIATVSEGETVTVTSGGNTYEVSISFIDSDEVKFIVNGQDASTSKLTKGASTKLSDGSYIGVRDISKLEVSGETGSATFSIGTGKLELTHGSDIKLNDDTINGVKAYMTKTAGSSGSEKLDKIVIEWRTDEEEFLSSASELEMPGFGGIKFTMSDFVRPTEEKVSIDPDGDTSLQLSLPVEDGMVSFNFLYSNASGEFIGLGKASDERLVTSNTSSITFTEKSGGNDLDSWMVASYAVTSEAESYVLRAKITYDSSALRNLTTIDKMVEGAWVQVCEDKKQDDSCNIGDVSLTIGTVLYTSGGTESVVLTGGSNVEFDTIYTKGGLKIYLPYLVANTTDNSNNGAVNFSIADNDVAGHNEDTFRLFMDGEDKDDTIAAGHEFYFTIDDTSSGNVQVKDMSGTGSGGSNGLEVGDSTSTYEAYIVGTNNETAPRIMHYTNPDEDYAEVYYPEKDSESYAEVYLTELGSTLSAAGQMVFKDSEKSSWSNKNVVVVGGSCINSAAATLLGGALCESAFTDATGVGAGQYVVQSYADGFTSGKVALLVAGYHAADTVAAASRLIEPGVSVDTAAGTKYIGTVGVSGSSTMSKQ